MNMSMVCTILLVFFFLSDKLSVLLKSLHVSAVIVLILFLYEKYYFALYV